jgi:hypothetical protein
MYALQRFCEYFRGVVLAAIYLSVHNKLVADRL